MEYFSLYSHCYLRLGDKKAAIYDVFGKRIFWAEKAADIALLRGSRRAESMEEISASSKTDKAALYSAALFYRRADLGEIYDSPRVSAKYRPFVHNYLETTFGYYRPLGVTTLEVSSQCPKRCGFCRPENRLATSECACGIYSSDTRISYDIQETLRHLAIAGVGLLELMGGDPYMNREDLERIIRAAKRFSIPVKIKTTGIPLDRTDMLFLKKNDVSLALTLVNLPNDPEEMSRLAGVLGMAAECDFRNLDVNLLFDEQNLDCIQETLGWLEKNRVPISGLSGYYPADVTEEPQRDRFAWFVPREHTHYAVDIDNFCRNIRGHSCWQDRIAIMANGDVRLCVAGKHRCGNIHDRHILDIIREERPGESVESKNADYMPCGRCEFSLGCFSCAVTTEKLKKTHKTQAWNCAYNPFEGEFSRA
jgi:MoaA/NifB/PqqE/SkfB family radical SAM enzyme